MLGGLFVSCLEIALCEWQLPGRIPGISSFLFYRSFTMPQDIILSAKRGAQSETIICAIAGFLPNNEVVKNDYSTRVCRDFPNGWEKESDSYWTINGFLHTKNKAFPVKLSLGSSEGIPLVDVRYLPKEKSFALIYKPDINGNPTIARIEISPKIFQETNPDVSSNHLRRLVNQICAAVIVSPEDEMRRRQVRRSARNRDYSPTNGSCTDYNLADSLWKP
jgi:hypothetical protein